MSLVVGSGYAARLESQSPEKPVIDSRSDLSEHYVDLTKSVTPVASGRPLQ